MDLGDLNQSQKRAVVAEGTVRVIAGAGSGKTRVLTHRIGHLVSARGVDPSHILAVTFTRKAAREMQERLQKLIGGPLARRLACGTFHSICYRMLKAYKGQPLAILDEKRRKALLRKALGPEGVNLDLEAGKVGAVISMSKSRLIDQEGFSREADDFFSMKITQVFALYEQWKDKDRLLDYDDLLLKCWKLLKTDQGLLQRYRERFSHILVDEFQDTNPAQFEIVRLLSPPQKNLFVVGDDWQSIYAWRGAVPENIIRFDQAFPGAVTIKLEQNYRSTKAILQGSGRLISFNRVRTEKTLWTENPEGREVEIIQAEDEEKEAALILGRLKSLLETNGTGFGDISILYRTNAQSRALEEACIRQKVPYRVTGAPGFYDRREIKDMIAYLRLVHDPNDDEALQRIINVPPRYLGRKFLKELKTQALYRRRSLFDSLGGFFSRPYMGRNAKGFRALIQDLRNYSRKKTPGLSDLVQKIRESTGYDRYICRDEDLTPDDSRIQNLNELKSALSRFERIEDFLVYAGKFKARSRERTDAPSVNLMTLHKSKGLEFPVVFIAGLAQGLLPHHKALHDGGLEEERRLCYVGMTRAMERLFISYPLAYQGKHLRASQFLEEAFPEHAET